MAKETQALVPPKEAAGQDLDSMGTMEFPTNLTEAMMEKEEEDSDEQQSKSGDSRRPKCFMMSGMGQDEQESFSKFLLSLGVSASSDFDTNATHIIAMKMSRSEKMLGRYVFPPSKPQPLAVKCRKMALNV